MSLYPFVKKRRAFPIGDPRVLTTEEVSTPRPWTHSGDNPYRGLLLVQVLPPQHLLRPLLPYRTPAGRLVFPLCGACSRAGEQRRRRCRHEPYERAWVAGYTHFELNLALDLGYRVMEVYEVNI